MVGEFGSSWFVGNAGFRDRSTALGRLGWGKAANQVSRSITHRRASQVPHVKLFPVDWGGHLDLIDYIVAVNRSYRQKLTEDCRRLDVMRALRGDPGSNGFNSARFSIGLT